MLKMCYIVESNSCIESLFNELDDYGFDYEIETPIYDPDALEITVECTNSELRDLESIFAPYV